ncbi:MAG: glycoside hydrolase family 3 C-terminal domain-containing protein [Treponemataceae bacterium]|nr:glycoside hydrolase family 3 C-terminal domain-containing protein [Treponemataceae bacterium]
MAKKASSNITWYENKNGPRISTVSRPVIEKDGLYFKDIDGSGTVSTVNDWRLPPAERAKAYAEQLPMDEKLPQLFISDWRMGKYPVVMGQKKIDHTPVLDESGVLDEAPLEVKNIFGTTQLPGTSTLIKEWWNRHVIIRNNATVEDLTDYLNQLQAVAEECDHFVPVQAASNSRNENGAVVFGMNDAGGTFATWPGTLGIAAAVQGAGIAVADTFADAVRRSWNACNLRKGYMYMVDCTTDPRWQRTYGCFGENPALIAEIASHIIPRIQGSSTGVTSDGVAVTTKHFPGGGARENGFDPHYAEGQWNVYATAGSLSKYHLPGFQAAITAGTSSIMPYYAKPAEGKSVMQKTPAGVTVPMKPYGFAYNRAFIEDLLRGELGFTGYINSDTGITHNMSWGVESLSEPERIGFAVGHAGVDLISGMFDNDSARESYRRSTNGWYDTHPAPEGFTGSELVLTEEAVNRAVSRTLTEMFTLGMFEDTYRDVSAARELVATKEDWAAAALAHRQSVTLLKNNGVLPLPAEKAAGKKVYAEAFDVDERVAAGATEKLRGLLSEAGISLTGAASEADIAVFLTTPSSGAYFNATKGFLELEICEGKTVCDVVDGCPTESTHSETTLSGLNRLVAMADSVHSRGGQVITNINVTLPWEVGPLESVSDALLVGYDTYQEATVDVILGRFSPVGKLPVTLPKDDSVIAVNKEGQCISPNDVPGFDKDQYLPDAMKDENGKAYAYRDAAGSYYEYGFGLTY